MKLVISKIKVVSFSIRSNMLMYGYKLCQCSIKRIVSIKDLGLFLDSKLHFHNYVSYKFSQCIKFLGLVRSVTFSLSSLEYLYILYFTLVA
jgi:hypothetical protein